MSHCTLTMSAVLSQPSRSTRFGCGAEGSPVPQKIVKSGPLALFRAHVRSVGELKNPKP